MDQRSQLTVQSFFKELCVQKPTINDVLAAKPLYSLRREYGANGEEFIKGLVVFFIVDLCTFFNPVRNMNSQQISQTAELLIELYDSYRPEDFVRCFKNIKALRYGKFFEGIDGGKIIEMVQQYDVEREQEIIDFNKNKSQQYKEEAKNLLAATDARVVKAMKDATEKMDIIKKADQYKPRERSAEEKIMDSWFNEFDKIFEEQNPDPGHDALRIVDYKGKLMGINEFLNCKLDEFHGQDK